MAVLNSAVKVQHYLQLLRVHHWIKNILVFVPLFFSINLFDFSVINATVLGFICFSVLSSIIYILNDIRDNEKTASTAPNAVGPWLQAKYLYAVQLSLLLFYLRYWFFS